MILMWCLRRKKGDLKKKVTGCWG